LPPPYWAHAANHAIYIRNPMPLCHHPNQIPQEILTGKHQDVSHLRVFGCRC
ncbi:MAG: hypothetical protein NXY57DRAFT_906662, partial [Lentinula lateritia]